MNDLCKSSGNIIYYPSHWIVLYCCEELRKYYAWFLLKYGIEAKHPRYGSHICVNYGNIQKPSLDKMHLWNKYNNQEIEFFYSNKIQTDGKYYWLNVFSDKLDEIRNELGLTNDLHCGLHLSIGHTKPENEVAYGEPVSAA